MTVLQGTMQDGTVVPVQVDAQGRLVAEGIQGPPGPPGEGVSHWQKTGSDLYYNQGRVGIGTSSPQARLHIDGAEDATGGITLSAGAQNHQWFLSSDFVNVHNIATSSASAAHTWQTNSTERVRIDSSGRLLVGTSSSIRAGKFQILSTGNDHQSLVGGNQIAQIDLCRSSNSAGGVGLVASGDILGRIDCLGNDGNVYRSAARIEAVVDGTPGLSDMPGRLVFSTTADGASSPTERMRLTSVGYLQCVGVYNLTTASAANVFVGSEGFLNRSTSSIRYKTDIENVEDQYSDALLQCRPVWYRSTCEKDNPSWGWWGFIAEEVAAIDPRLVHWKTTEQITAEDGTVQTVELETPEPEGVQYDRFVPHLLNLIKRQQQAIETLEAKVAALESA